MKQRIVHLGKFYFPEFGGIESATRDIAESLAKEFSTYVLCFSNESKLKKVERVAGVTVIRRLCRVSIMSQPLSLGYFLSALFLSRRCDVIHVHLPNFLALLSLLIMPRKPKIILHWHSDVLQKGILGLLLRPLEYFALKLSATIIITSKDYGLSSSALRHFSEKMTVIPLGIRLEDGPISKSHESQLDLNLSEFIGSRKLVLSVGRLVSYKGHDVLIKSFSGISDDACLVIVGTGVLQRELQELVEELQLEKSVCLAGKVSTVQLEALYQRASLFCLASRNRSEAFGVVLLEAMKYGLPVVATRIQGSGVPWVNLHGLSGLNVAVDCSSEFVEAINRLLCDSPLQNLLSNGARDRVKNTFDLKILAGMYRKIYLDL